MYSENFIVLTGAMGAGKSSVLRKLKDLNYTCIDEPAREILAEQRLIKGNGVPEINSELFTGLMLSRLVYQYKSHSEKTSKIFFDRGIPDMTGYAALFNIDKKIFQNASEEYRFNKNVFMFRGWKEIYVNDSERKMNFEPADKFGTEVRKIYEDLGYKIYDVPFSDLDTRVKFILDVVNNHT